MQPVREARKGLRAESARAVTGSGGGEDFLARGRFFFTKRPRKQKIDTKVGNGPSRQGLQTGHRQNLGSYGEKTDFRAAIRVFGLEKNSLFSLTMF